MSDYLFDMRRRTRTAASADAGADADADADADPVSVSVSVSDPDSDSDSDSDSDPVPETAVRELEQLLGGFAHRAPLRELPPQRRWRRPVGIAIAAGLAAAALVLLFVWRRGPEPGHPVAAADECGAAQRGFAFSVAGGPARCAGEASARGTLPVGAWLETSGAAVADVQLADIGQLTVYGDSRVRLVGTSATQHRMELARGKVSARVIAPPRLFIVDTPGATAVDLGCAYELTVDESGRTHLRVTSGVVSLEGKGLVSYAPALTEVIATPGRGPGTPVSFRAAPALREAIDRFDLGDTAALADVIDSATEDDTVTLWNLLPRARGADRAAVMEGLEAWRPRPEGVSAEAILAGDRDALERWRDELEIDWGGSVRKLKPHR